LEVRDSKDKAELIQNHEIRVIANTRKDRIVALEMENQRLRMKIGAVSGSREMVDLFNELAGEDAISELQSRYKSTQVQVEKLMELAASIGATSQQLEEVRLRHCH
jgi:FKBP-type peptidyl-prolyl cis-trans isomerase 2